MVGLILAFAFAGVPQNSGIVITLERTACFGPCPAYRVTVDGEGTVTYNGVSNVRVTGEQTAHLPVSAVRRLLETVERIGFFDLQDRYHASVTDNPTTYVSITMNGKTKRIEDYVSGPEPLKQFQKQIDETAGTLRWIRIDTETLKRMSDDGTPPTEAERNEMLMKAVQSDDVAVIQALLDLGADANGSSSAPPLMRVRSGAAARLLLAAGANPFPATTSMATLMWTAAYKEPGVIEALLAAGVPPNAVDQDAKPLLWLAACAGNFGAVSALLKAGADPRAQMTGTSALDCATRTLAAEKGGPKIERAPYIDFERTVSVLEQALRR